MRSYCGSIRPKPWQVDLAAGHVTTMAGGGGKEAGNHSSLVFLAPRFVTEVFLLGVWSTDWQQWLSWQPVGVSGPTPDLVNWSALKKTFFF